MRAQRRPTVDLLMGGPPRGSREITVAQSPAAACRLTLRESAIARADEQLVGPVTEASPAAAGMRAVVPARGSRPVAAAVRQLEAWYTAAEAARGAWVRALDAAIAARTGVEW